MKANKGPLAADGIIWVQGNISGLPSSATNTIPPEKDIFSNNFVGITQGGTVEWHNLDTDEHAIAPVRGWPAPINPANIGAHTIQGTQGTQGAPPQGEVQRITFNTPGLYYYYCPIHADVNTTWKRAVSHTNASENPIPMEGFVLVTGK